VSHAKLEVKTASTTILDRNRALIILRTMMKGIGNMSKSVRRLAQVTHMSISPMRCRPIHFNPPNVLGFQVFPVCGGQIKMYKNQGINALPTVKIRMAYRTLFSHSITDPALRSSIIMEAFTNGRIAMLMRLKAITTWI
jgi:hypothetical protein